MPRADTIIFTGWNIWLLQVISARSMRCWLIQPGFKQKLDVIKTPQALIADYERFGRKPVHDLICRTLRLSYGICARDRRQLLPQLHGRLLTYPSAVAFWKRIKSRLTKPAMLALQPSLASPGLESARLEGHGDKITVLLTLPDGRVASASKDCSIRIWDTDTYHELARLQGHKGSVTSLVLLPDGLIASASEDATIRLWNIANGNETNSISTNRPITALALLSGNRLVGGCNDGSSLALGVG